MPRPRRNRSASKQVEALRHEQDTRTNIPTAEYQSLVREEQEAPLRVAYQRRNRDLDPQLVWRGKDEQDLADLVVNVPPLYIQEKVHPKALVDDLRRQSGKWRVKSGERDEGEEPPTDHSSLSTQIGFADLFADFNGLPEGADRTEFYQHDGYWQNRMILGDSLQVMASLSEREGLQGKVQCIYIDPPYGIRFNSNFQWSTTSKGTDNQNDTKISREPEQVKAFRDTWRDGIHSYLTYLRDRLTVARDLLADSGSIFVQIGDENVHRVRAVMDEVFGDENFVVTIEIQKKGSQKSNLIDSINDHLLWYTKTARSTGAAKFRQMFLNRPLDIDDTGGFRFNYEFTDRTISASHFFDIPEVERREYSIIRNDPLTSGGVRANQSLPFTHHGKTFEPNSGSCWKTTVRTRDGSTPGMQRLAWADRIGIGRSTFYYRRKFDDFAYKPISNLWTGFGGASDQVYVVQTNERLIERLILMTTDPGDLVLDPTCGSGTTAYVAEQWGRRWITIDTSRVALALSRARIMGARYPYYLLADSKEGQLKEAELSRRAPSEMPTYGNVRQGFVYARAPHITLGSIANNAEIDVIWEEYQEKLEPLREGLNRTLETAWEEWEIPRDSDESWPEEAQGLHKEWWELRIARQKKIDTSIAAQAEYEYLYDKPYEDRGKVRVAGPFTVESISPHRVLGVDENGEVIDGIAEARNGYGTGYDFGQVILDNLKRSGVQQAHREDRITFTSLTPWPGRFVCAEGRYSEEWIVDSEERGGELTTNHYPLSTAARRAAIFIGPEFGTVSRPDLVEAAREAAECGFDVLIACAFNYDAHTTEFESLGRIPVLKARMNADLHMAGELKNTGNGNLFVIFGEPDVEVASEEWLVDSFGRRVAPYDIFKVVSGVDSLAEINGLDGESLHAYAELSCRREIWDYLADAAGGVLDTGEHRGRAGQAHDGGVSPVAWRCAGFPGGTGDLPDLIRKAGNDIGQGFSELVDRLRRDKQNAQRPDALTLHSPLTTGHYSQVTVHGVDVFHPNTGEVRSDGPEGIACWFIDTDYNQESFFVRHAYFLGANDPYKSLKTTLKADIDEEAWATLNRATSRPFPRPESGRIAVKVINHLGDEVMKVFRVSK